MTKKSFKTYKPTEKGEFDINGTVFHLNPVVPGDILLDFLEGANSDDPAAMAKTVRQLMVASIVPEEHEAWTAYIRDPENNVTLEVLGEIAGYVSEVLSGNPQNGSGSPG